MRSKNKTNALLVVAAAFLIPCSLRAFTYADFSSTAGLNLVGSAAQNGSALRLTPASGSQMGSAWYTQPQHVSGGFTTTFSFRLTNPAPPGADGISFNVQSVGINAVADEQGTTSGVSISFNTFLYGDEPSDNFIGIYRNGFGENSGRLSTFDLNSTPLYMKDGNVHNTSITYSGSAFSLTIDGTSIFNNFAVSLTPGTDANGNGYVGFGSRTGLFWEDHDVLNWTFTPVPEPAALLACGALGLLARQLRLTRTRASTKFQLSFGWQRSEVRSHRSERSEIRGANQRSA
jgi:hypothetical protein